MVYVKEVNIQKPMNFASSAMTFSRRTSKIHPNATSFRDMLNHKLTILYFLLIAVFCANCDVTYECGIQYSINRIIDGTVTDLREFPWMALLIYQTPDGPGLACGGVLVNERFVLTAAHCVTGSGVEKIGKLIAVRLGEHDTRTSPDCDGNPIDEDCAAPHIDVYVESVFPHPNYTGESFSRHNDVALVKLQTSVAYSKDLQPICLPSASKKLLWENQGTDLHISGWGQTEFREVGSFIKLKAKVPVANQIKCNSLYAGRGITLGNSQMCAGGGTTDSCKGDSGGPLMFEDESDPIDTRWYVVGITSFGATPCATKDVPGIYTKISFYLDWITDTLKL